MKKSGTAHTCDRQWTRSLHVRNTLWHMCDRSICRSLIRCVAKRPRQDWHVIPPIPAVTPPHDSSEETAASLKNVSPPSFCSDIPILRFPGLPSMPGIREFNSGFVRFCKMAFFKGCRCAKFQTGYWNLAVLGGRLKRPGFVFYLSDMWGHVSYRLKMVRWCWGV